MEEGGRWMRAGGRDMEEGGREGGKEGVIEMDEGESM